MYLHILFRQIKVPVPWKEILTCPEFYSLAAMHFGYNWGFYTLLTELPTYLDKILHFSLSNVRIISNKVHCLSINFLL